MGFRVVAFFNGWLYYDAFFEVLKESLKGEKSVPKCSKYKNRKISFSEILKKYF